ncbi:unnamed protein product [Moneuplotes crassus]|uniref:Uncharacterized protein n=1 Tax=Euplotes crassus TaxID=5936 RepID=A0AAD1XXK2_EUPCR|nr:unnamed protein product [Moneuplotes crassus]
MFARRTFNLMRGSSRICRSIPKRNYSLKILQNEYFPDSFEAEFEIDAAEANPIKMFLDEEFIRTLSERQRMARLIEEDPDNFPGISHGETITDYFERQYKGILPQVVEDFNFNALPEPEPATIDDEAGAEDPTSHISKIKK